MEAISQLGKLLPEFVVLILALCFFVEFNFAFLDDTLQIAPRLFQSLHGEPGVSEG